MSVLAAFMVSFDAGRRAARHQASQRLVIAEAVLRTAVARYQYLPTVLALDMEVRRLLAAESGSTETAQGAAALNAKFQKIAGASAVSAIYVMDESGLTLSASNWQDPLSFVGSSYAYRPYFTAALATGASRYFGVGNTTGVPGLFIGKAVMAEENRIAGVVVVKVDLEELQAEWRAAGEQVLVSDAAGIVFLSSEPRWKYRPFHSLGAAEAARVRMERQYGESELDPLFRDERPDFGGEIALPAGDRMFSGLVERVTMPDLGWTITYLAPTGPALRQALLVAATSGIFFLALGFALTARSQRRLRLRSERAMRVALEQRVAERTVDLSAANDRLRGEIAERERTTVALRATQAELIHAGRLAAVGQISTAISHEVNQPLAALRTFLASTAIFLERGDVKTVCKNLERMTKVTQRIADIVHHLKDFARKTGPEHREPVGLRAASDAVLDLLQARIRNEAVSVECTIPTDAFVLAEPVRLEQVLLNLIVNALDAMRDKTARRLELTAMWMPDSAWRLAVSDSGGGIDPAHMAQLFDPFFTTKRRGEGLGLGLSLSSLIVHEFGGSIAAANGDAGAVLTVSLPAAEPCI